MVATVTGNGQGLLASSKSVLGSGGQWGAAGLGQGGELAYVNAKTGSLVVQRLDEFLAGRGPDLGTLRTYNSNASFDFDNNDGWQLSLYRKLYALTGTLNTVGSTITRASADGSQLVYTYEAASAAYVNRSGGGAADTLVFNSATNVWTWTDGDSRTTETYSVAPTTGEWRITTEADTAGNTLSYSYDANGLLSQIIDANGETTRLNYDGATRRLNSIDVVNGGVTTTRVRYSYDTAGRLSSVSTDLTPGDGSVADGKVFTTSYTYDGSSNRLASIINSDGTQLAIAYDASGRVSTLTDGQGKVTRFAYGVASTTVTDPLGLSTTLSYDAAGNLLRLQGPSGSGQDVQYAYNANGDLVQMTDSRGNGVTYVYDAAGNLLRQQDSAGNVVERAYNSVNQLIRETIYAIPDPDGSGAAQAGGAQATRYVRDAGQRVRFVLTPEGRVTEYRYDAYGQQTAALSYTDGRYTIGSTEPVEADLQAWAALQDKTAIQRVDSAYDARGLLTQVIRYAATDATGTGISNGREAVSRYTYDAAGRLLQQIDPRGTATATANGCLTAYAYDGLGRVLSVSQYDAAGSLSRETRTTYNDASRQIRLTLANGLERVSTYDTRGLLLSVVEQNAGTALSTQSYQYDADGRLRVVTDAAGGKRYYFYDALGRKVGEVDPTGALTETVYDGLGLAVRSVRYANAVSAGLNVLFSADAAGVVADVALASARPATSSQDQVTRQIFDEAGRLRFVIDATGALTETRYDGAGRIVGMLSYANRVNNFAGLDALGREPVPGDIQFVSTVPSGGAGSQIGLLTDSANDRITRNLYDNDGLLLGTLDGEGYLTEYRYDARSRLTQTVRYAVAVDAALRVAGSMAQLIASANTNAGANIQTWRFYDGLGRVVGELDGESYLTTYAYDQQGNLVTRIRYANRLSGTPQAGKLPAVMASAPAAVPVGGYVLSDSSIDQTVRQSWTAFNQLETVTAADGTVSRYGYDALGNQVSLRRADGTAEAVEQRSRYDVQGRLIQSLSPLGVAALAALGAEPTQAQVDAVWLAYGTSYRYDAAGRRTQSRDANGNISWYFYDADNRLTFTVRRVADPLAAGRWVGEVSERRYNVLGQVAADLVYANRLGDAVVATLQGGSDTSLRSACTSIANSETDSQTSYTYDSVGRLFKSYKALPSTTVGPTTILNFEIITQGYNAFGEVISVDTTIDSSRTRTDRYTYDRRGLQTTRADDATALNRRQTATYDAFGRLVLSVDGRGITQRTTYDKLGRTIQTRSADGSLNLTRSATYDAFDRILTQTDATGVITRYAYDTANRTLTTTVDGGGLSLVMRQVADRKGQLLTLVDANGNETRYSYDANGNLLTTKRWDKAANTETALQTNTFDTAGLLLQSSRDANGNVVAYTYDASGRVLSRTVDPGALRLVTQYAYDAKGQVVTVTDPSGIVTRNAWDRAGRKLSMTVDPSGLNLVTTYSYDLAGDLLTVTEGAGSATPRTTQYQYDTLGRRVREVVDPSGLAIATVYAYDADNNLVGRTEAAGTAKARLIRYTYDDANRLLHTIDALGTVSRNDYDNEGRLLQTTAYASAIPATVLAGLGAAPGATAVTAALVSSGQDRITRHRYDAAGRERFTIDALGAVTERRYDANGNVTQTVLYANALTGSLGPTDGPQVVDVASAGTYVLRNPAADRVMVMAYDGFNRLVSRTEASGTAVARTERWAYDAAGNALRHTDVRGNDEWFAYDAAGRQTVHIDAAGYVTRKNYTADGRVSDETRFMTAVGLPAVTNDRYASQATPAANADTVSGDRITRYAYDGAGRLISRTDAAGITTAYAYDTLGQVIDTTEAAGTSQAVVLHRTYDLAGRLLNETRAYGSDSASTTAYTYDALGNQTSIIVAVGTAGVRTTTQVFDALGRKVSATDGAGGTLTTAYNAFGDIVKVTDARGNAGYFYTDALGRVTLQVDPEGAVIETRYDLLGNSTDSIRYAGRVVGTLSETTRPQVLDAPGSGTYVLANAATDERQTTLFDTLGRRSEIRTWWGSGANEYYTERFTYDGAGNVLSSVARNGATTIFEYDKANRKLREVLPIASKNAGGASVAVENRFAYDALGNLIQKTEAWGLPEQRTTQLGYDKLNREITRTGDAINTYDPVTGTERLVTPTTRKTYDLRGNLIEETDARGGRTIHYYDKADREIGRIDPTGAYTQWTYDAAGNKLSQTSYARLVAVVGGAAIPNDRPPVLAAVVPATGAYVLLDVANDRTTSYSYDAVGRQTGSRVDGVITGYFDTVANIYRPTANTSVFTQNVFDAAGNLVKSVDGNGNVTRFYYNRAGQQVGQLDALGYLVTWTRDAWGNVTRLTRYAKAVTGLTVGDATSLSQIQAAVQSDANDRITDYTFDRMNRVLSETVLNVATGSVSAAGGLTESAAQATIRYTYDGLNNITQKTDAQGRVTNWSYDAAGRKVSEIRPGFVDYRGITVRPESDYEYDGINNLKRQLERGENDASEADDRITTYTYGAGGFIASRTDANGYVTRFGVDAAGNVTRSTLVGRLTASGARVDDVVTYRYDQVGRQIMTTDVGTAATTEMRYNAFGQVTGKRINGGGIDRAWTEFADYDKLGRVWRSNSGDGVTKVWVFDKAGNATLKIDSAGTDLSSLDLATILALQSPVTNQTVSIFDARNQLIDTIQPSMIGDGHQTIAIQQTLIEAQATSFAGVGNVALYQQAGALAALTGTASSAAVSAAASAVTSVTGLYSDSYTYDAEYSIGVTSSTHTVTLNLPNTSAYGDGALLVTANMQAAYGDGVTTGGTLSGGVASVWVPTGQQSVTLTIPETFDFYRYGQIYQPPARSHSYCIYKQTANGLVLVGDSGFSTAQAVTTQVSQNLVSFGVQPATASRMLMQYRRAGSNDGWSVTNVPPQTANGQPLAGRFGFDWSGWARGAYEYRTIALDASGNVVNSGTGTLNLQDGAPSISKTNDLVGGAGRVFMDTNGRLNFTEQGATTGSLTIRTRPAGSTGLWSTRQVLNPATVAGAVTPGWFQFDPAAAGLSGATEYIIESRDASGQVLQKTAGSFIAGQPGTVSALMGYTEPAPIARFNQPVSGQSMVMSYRLAGTTGGWTQVSVPKAGTGMFDWDTSGVFKSDTTTADYEYQYETRDAAGTLVNKAHGSIRLGKTPSILSHVNDNTPTLVSLSPPAGNATAANASRMALSYRLSGTGTWLTTTLTRSDLSKPFVLDVSSLIPPGSQGSLDYRFTLQDANGLTIKAVDGTDLDVAGVLQVGTAPDAQILSAVASGSTGPTISLIHRRQDHNAFGDVSSETDGRGYVTQLSYNTLGKLTQKTDPETTVVLANGYQLRQRPVTSWIYDLSGNQIAQRDPNGNVTTLASLAGSFGDGSSAPVVTEYHADGSKKQNGYDRLGNLRFSTDEIGRRTDYSYDLSGQLTRIDRPTMASGARAWDTWVYDGAGHRIRHTTTPDGSTLYSDTTEYDSQGRITATVSALGRRTSLSYLWKTDIVGLASLKTGGWQTTTTDAMGRTSIDQADTFGRKTRHTDLGGHIYSYVYNQAGWLIQQGNSLGQNIATDYYANGYVKRITDYALATRTDYEYDANGNRTYEAYQRTVNGQTEYLQNATVSYDELNRVKEVVDPRATIRYEYDANGNRRHVWSYYHNGIDGNINVQDYWYLYDQLNRFTVTMGQLSTGTRATSATDTTVRIIAGSTGNGVEISYNLAGERKSARYARDNHLESYDYDATGHLTDTWITPSGGTKALAARRQNDLLGRTVSYSEYNAAGSQTYLRNTAYDADNRTLSQSGTDGSSTFYYYDRMVAGTVYDDTAGVSQSGRGELALIQNSNSGTTTSTWTAYAYWDDAKETAKTINGYNPALKQNNAQWKSGMSSLDYDMNGHLKSATDAGKDGVIGTGDDIRFDYIDNAQGLTLKRDQAFGGTVTRTHRYLYLDGHGIGDVGNDGETLKDYAQTLTQPKQTKEQTYKNWKPIATADFDQNWQPINPGYPGATPASYTAKAGDTLMGIASAIWGDSSLWYLIADANGLTGSSALTAGQVLTLPNQVTNVHNNAQTWRPYDAGRVIGDTSPTLPDAPPAPPVYQSSGGGKKGCGGFAAIIVAIVVVVVAIVIQQYELIPAAIEGLGPTATMVYTAAVANVAGQAVGMAIGAQANFSWGSLAASMMTAGMGSAAGAVGVTNTVGAAMINAGASNLVTQGMNMLSGEQHSFSWSSLAASVLSAPIAQSLTSSLTGTDGAFADASKATQAAVSGTTRALVSAATRVAIQGGRLSWSAVTADALSSTISSYYDSQRQAASTSEQPKDQIAREENQYDLGAISRDSGQAIDWSRSIKLADSGGTMTDGLSPTEEAMLAVRGDQVRIGNGNAADDAEVERIVRAKEAAYQGKSDPLGRSDGIYQGNDVWSYPVADNRIETRPLPELTTASGSVQADPGLLSNLGNIAGAYWDGRVGFRDAMGMVNGQIGGVTNVARDTITGTLNGLITVPEFAGNLLLQGTMPGDPGYVSLPKFSATGKTGSLQSDIGMIAPVLLGVRGSGAIGEAGELAGTATLRAELADADALRRTYLNEKFGRTGNIDLDINIRGNKETAFNFYRDSGYAPVDIPSHIAGIDFTLPVTVETLATGKTVYQWQVPGNSQGNYYAFSPNVTPDLLGANPVGTNWATKTLGLRTPTAYVTTQPVSGLRSTSAAIWDTWSESQPFYAVGGGTQFFSPAKSAFTKVLP